MTPGFLRRSSGFSIVELMVSVAIGMLALAFAVRMVAGSEKTRETELGGSDSMQNGMVALFSISGDANQAGFGLNDSILAGCDTRLTDTGGYALAPGALAGTTPLAPVVIEANGSAPDRISFYAGSSLTGTATLRLTASYASGTRVTVDRVPYGFSQGDVVVVAPELVGGGRCALAQLSSNPRDLLPPPGPQYVDVALGTGYRFNSGNLGVGFTGGQARMFNLGKPDDLSFHSWSVSNGFLQLRSTDLSGSSAGAAAVTDNIVSIKAQYGFDTRTGTAFQPQNGMQVMRWSSTMIDADANGTIGNAIDYQHVAAVRLAVVARSKAVERAAAGSACTSTAEKPQVFKTAIPQSVTAVPVTVDVAVAGDPNDWRCYRYRVFETVVNLRNAGWRPEAWNK
ncbi:PilW family protein [Herbaspirillum sp. SJZ107]|uniref:PilW family protein n=1 Tax=Herbaspirillum sp. SJZ107 TaxID=2572881 RepID=UPI001150F601|nr:PilW family protein [Herbaspirillum sp. SJZ107]TQK11725.1 type IV pilus assembly protein PilW [Herbaspirillum sp. SJZ107]